MNHPPPILHVISRLDRYGGARLLRHVAAEHAAAGQGVAVAALVADEGIVAELTAANVAVHTLGSRWRYDPLALWRLAQLRRPAHHELLHAWDPLALEYAALSGRGTPTVAAWTSLAAPTAWTSKAHSTAFAMLTPGVAAPRGFLRNRTTALQELHLPLDARIVAVTGPLVRSKDFDEAIWCFELVRVLHPSARMLIFGDGPDRPRLERFAHLVSEPGCVTFCGYRADWAEFMSAVDVYWQLDAARTTPYALLESMARGVPPVVSSVPALLAALSPSESGLIAGLKNRADVARATDQLFRDPAFARQLGDNAAVAVRERWSIDRSVAACDELYRAVLTRR